MEIFDNHLNIFSQYIADNYDINNPLIKLKYLHTLRVSNLMIEIGKRFNLNIDDLLIAYLIGLFHDLGRFREVIRTQAFNNLKFDHGAYSNKILYNDKLIEQFNIGNDLNLLIRKALYYHNKKDIAGNLTDREMFYSKLIRDADKIDIINIISSGRKLQFNSLPSTIVYDAYLKGKSIDLKDLENRSDRVILYLGFAKHLYFDESKLVLKEQGYLEKMIENIDVLDQYIEVFNEIINNLIANSKGEKKYVR